MAAPQLPVNFDPGFLRGGGRSCFVKNVSVGFDIKCLFLRFSRCSGCQEEYSPSTAGVYHVFMPKC